MENDCLDILTHVLLYPLKRHDDAWKHMYVTSRRCGLVYKDRTEAWTIRPTSGRLIDLISCFVFPNYRYCCTCRVIREPMEQLQGFAFTSTMALGLPIIHSNYPYTVPDCGFCHG